MFVRYMNRTTPNKILTARKDGHFKMTDIQEELEVIFDPEDVNSEFPNKDKDSNEKEEE